MDAVKAHYPNPSLDPSWIPAGISAWIFGVSPHIHLLGRTPFLLLFRFQQMVLKVSGLEKLLLANQPHKALSNELLLTQRTSEARFIFCFMANEESDLTIRA